MDTHLFVTGRPMSTVDSASWCFNIEPKAGWGSPTSSSQLATAGWLSMVPVFEPHWQVCVCVFLCLSLCVCVCVCVCVRLQPS
jgi:hypothetical protein